MKSAPVSTLMEPCSPPVALAIFGSGADALRSFPVTWAGLACASPASLTLMISWDGRRDRIFRRREEFTVSYLSAEHQRALRGAAPPSEGHDARSLPAGLSLTEGKRIRVPMLRSSPLSLECRVLAVRPAIPGLILTAEVLAFHRQAVPTTRFWDSCCRFSLKKSLKTAC